MFFVVNMSSIGDYGIRAESHSSPSHYIDLLMIVLGLYTLMFDPQTFKLFIEMGNCGEVSQVLRTL